METEIASQVRVTGGARIGWLNASWPFASLTASATSIVVAVRMIGTYELRPDDVVALESFGVVPFVGKGVQIVHTRADVPERVVFFSRGDPERLIERIRQTGFAPRASAAAMPQRSMPIRLLPIIIPVVAWNAALFLDGFGPWTPPPPGPLLFLPVPLMFLIAFALPRSSLLQAIVLKPGRSIDEIRGVLNLMLVVSGFMLVVYALFVYLDAKYPMPG